ncbi:MAG: radical SAM protein [Myxococcota bacterium]
MRVLLVTPPMTQLNGPYPATGYLLPVLRAAGHEVAQVDGSLEWFLRITSEPGLGRVLQALADAPSKKDQPYANHVRANRESIRREVPLAVRFLQGREPGLAIRIAGRDLFTEGPRFQNIGPPGQSAEYLDWAFGAMGVLDRARYVASLVLEEWVGAIREALDPGFDFARYAESLASSQPTLDPLLAALERPSVPKAILEELTAALLAEHRPEVVGMSLPFPGNVLGALVMARQIRALAPKVKIAWGGGYPNTELRELSEPRLFDLIDAVTYDDGERPFLNLLEHWAGQREASGLLRTRVREGGAVVFRSAANEEDLPFKDLPAPSYAGLRHADYPSILGVLNPMHRLWSERGQNKLTVAHGCYWKKCSFCDLSLDYISRYNPVAGATIVDRMEALIAENGSRLFHFVDEAAPPAALRSVAEEILRRGLVVSWWGNIRFEKSFDRSLCTLLRRSGCIAFTGGLEVASNRLLKRMNKGVTIEQVARVSKAMNDAGIMVHAYLMYGFPTETEQETIDALEVVRQLFEAGCIDSGYWHRFAATAHAPIGLEPEKYGIELMPMPPVSFAKNDLAFEDPTGCAHERYTEGLNKAIFNWMHGIGIEADVRDWFEFKVPKAKVPKALIREALGG